MAVDLYVLRHGIAAGVAGRITHDDERPLTDEGKIKTREAVRGFLTLEPHFDAIYTSPLVRAVQTARILEEEYDGVVPVIETPTLVNGGSDRQLLRVIAEQTPKAHGVVVVGHEPYLSNLISKLAFGMDRGTVDFKKAGMAEITLDGLPPKDLGILRWLATPRILRQMAQGS